METTYRVDGMSCMHCVKHVTEEVGKIPGVTVLDLSLEDGVLTIESDEPVDFAAIEAAVDEAGDYTVHPL